MTSLQIITRPHRSRRAFHTLPGPERSLKTSTYATCSRRLGRRVAAGPGGRASPSSEVGPRQTRGPITPGREEDPWERTAAAPGGARSGSRRRGGRRRGAGSGDRGSQGAGEAPPAPRRGSDPSAEHRHPALLAARHAGRQRAEHDQPARGHRLSRGRAVHACRARRPRPGEASSRPPTSGRSPRTSASTAGATSSTRSSTRPRRWACSTSASPGSSRTRRRRARPIAALAREFDRYAERVADRGMRFYYHNHNFEFARDGGTRLYDILLDRTDPDLVFFEMDLYWTVTAGVDPLDYLARFDQSRFPLFHVKDRDAAGNFADLGEGNINFARIFRELPNKHYHHYFVERDTQANPARTAAVGYEYLRDLRGARKRKPYTTDGSRRRRVRVAREEDEVRSLVVVAAVARRRRGAAVRGGRPVPRPVAVSEGHPQRPSRRADEPGGAARRARAACRAHGRDPPAQPAQRHQQHRHRHEGGPAGALSARRGGRPGHRARPGVRGQRLGLRLLLAEAEHADGRARHRHQRG